MGRNCHPFFALKMAAPRSRDRFGRGGCNDLSCRTRSSSDWGTPQYSILRKLDHNTAKQATNCGTSEKTGAREQGYNSVQPVSCAVVLNGQTRGHHSVRAGRLRRAPACWLCVPAPAQTGLLTLTDKHRQDIRVRARIQAGLQQARTNTVLGSPARGGSSRRRND